MATTQTLLTFEEFAALPEEEGVRRELDEGVVIEMPHAGLPHGTIQGNVYRALANWRDRAGSAFRVSQNVDFKLAANTVRIPDVCVLRDTLYQGMEVARGTLVGAPDLAVEVVSPSNSAVDLDRKVVQYLRAGARAVWLVYPETRHVIAYRRSGEIHRYESGAVLEEPEVLPGLVIQVDELFAGV